MSDRGLVDDLTKEFIAESLEGLERADACLSELEASPQDAALLGEIFRCIHTIKGTTGFLGLPRLEALAHAGEHLLGALRSGRLELNVAIADVLLELFDRIRLILDLLGTHGHEGRRPSDHDGDILELLASVDPDGGAEPMHRMEGAAAVDPLAQATPQNTEPKAEQGAQGARGNIADNTLRIDVEVLNRLMNLVGELVLTRNQLLQSTVGAANFPQLTRRLDNVTTDLRETVMQARLQPVGNLFSKFPRMVRDLARACGKAVRIEFSGQDTGLDKSLLEAIKDPLTHALRNCIDHGIETPRDRVLAGKPEEGVVRMSATHHNGLVMIDIDDDGAGIQVQRVLLKAIDRQLITAAAAGAMSEQEALDLIFLPGFSTAEAVSHVSGRGVGMDVVRTNIEKVGGSLELNSIAGSGTKLRLRVPLTLAIVPALVVASGGESYCLPQASLAELVYVPRREAAAAIERLGETELYRLRDSLLPLIRLDDLLETPMGERTRQDHGFYLAILDAEGCRFGLMVDDLMVPEEIVVKPLSAALRELGLFSGAAVLGNGAIALILDVAATAARAGVRTAIDKAASSAAMELAATELVATGLTEPLRSFLIYENRSIGDGGDEKERTALPLEVVERIETVSMQLVEFADGRPLLQYRGSLLPLEDRCGVLAELRSQGPDAMATIVICTGRPVGQVQVRTAIRTGKKRSVKAEDKAASGAATGRVGIVVRRVMDVAEGEFMDETVSRGDGCLVLVGGRVILLETGYCNHSPALFREVA